jgi:sugar phosphate isomerase/epimerase
VLAALAFAGSNVWEKPHEVLEMVARAGYDAVDIDAEPDRIEARRFEQVVAIAESFGLKISGLLGAWGTWHSLEERDLASTDEQVRQHAVTYARKCVDLSATVGGPVFEICAVPYESEYPECSVPLDVLRRSFVRSCTELAAHAAERGAKVAIEPLNRFEGYAGFMNSVVDAMTVVDEVGMDSLGVMADLFHVNIEDVSLCDALTRAGGSLMHVHLADSNRQAPGTGHVDFQRLIRTLRTIGYSGYLALDCIPLQPDPETVLETSIAYMKGVEEAVELQSKIYPSA